MNSLSGQGSREKGEYTKREDFGGGGVPSPKLKGTEGRWLKIGICLYSRIVNLDKGGKGGGEKTE